MKRLAHLAAAILFAASTTAADSIVVDTPLNATICEPIVLSWAGGIPPYAVTIAQVVDSAFGFLDFGETGTETSFTWIVNITYGVDNPLVVSVIDSARNIAQSQLFMVHDSSDHSCLTASPSSSSTGSNTPSGSTTTTPTSATTSSIPKPSINSWGEIIGIGMGILATLLLLAFWRLYIIRKRRSSGIDGDKENLFDRKAGISTMTTLEMAKLGETREKQMMSKGGGKVDVFDQNPF
jgi:hypothetical protein